MKILALRAPTQNVISLTHEFKREVWSYHSLIIYIHCTPRYVIAATRSTTTLLPTTFMMQDLESYEKASKSTTFLLAEENRAVVFNLQLFFSSALIHQSANSRIVLSYVTRCLVVGTRCESRDVVLICLRNLCSFQDDTIRAYMSSTNLLLRAVQATSRIDSCYTFETLSVLLNWFDRNLVSVRGVLSVKLETITHGFECENFNTMFSFH